MTRPAGDLELIGYGPSVYCWIVRWTLAEIGLAARWREVDPFAPRDGPPDWPHPFGRVPVLIHGELTLYETAAITRYLDEAFPGPGLQPGAPAARARLVQIQSLVDTYAYWPLVRQVFAQAVFAPASGTPGDAAEVEAGLKAAQPVLAALDALASDEAFLLGADLSLADLHLGPMLAYFAMAPEAAALVERSRRLGPWLRRIARRPAFRATWPPLPKS